MLAGATGIDFALLLIAADDGVMPQTREHLAVLSLLGIRRGALVVTKADRVHEARVAEVVRDARALIRGTSLEDAPMHVVSAVSGAGIDGLRALLREAAHASVSARDPSAGFRLAVDRVFTLAGAGTVVTGTAHAGAVAVGDELVLAPGGASPLRARVRSIHAQNTTVDRAMAGQRVALGVAGVDKAAIERGDWLVAPAVAIATERIDVQLDIWRDEPKPLRSGATVHVHIGAGEAMATVAVLDTSADTRTDSGTDARTDPGDDARTEITVASASHAASAAPSRRDAIAPGDRGRVQLVLRRPLAAWRGDRVVLRDASGSRTIAGGVVLDPLAPARYRRTPQRLAMLDAAERPSAQERLEAALVAAPEGIDLDAWRRIEGRAADDAAGSGATTSSIDAILFPEGSVIARRQGAAWLIGADHAAAWNGRIVAALARFHRERTDEPGPETARLRRLAAPRMHEALWRALLASAVEAGMAEQRGAQLSLPGHASRLSVAEQRIVEKVAPKLLAGGFDPPWVRTLAAETREPEAVVRTALQHAALRGELHQVVKDLYFPQPTLARAAALVRGIAAREGAVSAAAFRDASGLGRKRAIQIVEYFDRVGLLRRVGDLHRLRTDCELFDASATAP